MPPAAGDETAAAASREPIPVGMGYEWIITLDTPRAARDAIQFHDVPIASTNSFQLTPEVFLESQGVATLVALAEVASSDERKGEITLNLLVGYESHKCTELIDDQGNLIVDVGATFVLQPRAVDHTSQKLLNRLAADDEAARMDRPVHAQPLVMALLKTPPATGASGRRSRWATPRSWRRRRRSARSRRRRSASSRAACSTCSR